MKPNGGISRAGRGWLKISASVLVMGAAQTHGAEPSAFTLRATGIGVLGRTDLGIAMIESRASAADWLYLSVAPTLLQVRGTDTATQLRVGPTLQFHVGALLIEDRNQWIFSSNGTIQYRNRLRFTAPMPVNGRMLRLMLLDEASYEYGRRGWYRNVIGAGVGFNPTPRISTELYRMWQDDTGRSMTGTVVVLLSLRLH